MVLQTEAAECGLACIAMVLSHHGHHVSMSLLRGRYNVPLKGMTLPQMIGIVESHSLEARPVAVDMDTLDLLTLPCILHWNFNHYVVLSRVGKRSIHIMDPARGNREVPLDEASRCITGIALEMRPNASFEAKEEKVELQLRSLFKGVSGLGTSVGQIVLIAAALELVSLLLPYFMKTVVDGVLVSQDSGLLWALLAGFSLLVLVQQGLGAMRSWMLLYLSTHLSLHWREGAFRHLLRLPMSFFTKRTLGDIVARFGALDQIQKSFTSSFVEVFLDGAVVLVMFAVMLWFSAPLTLAAAVVVLLQAAMRAAFLNPQRLAAEKQFAHAAKQHSHFLESIRGARTLKLFVKQTMRQRTWSALLSQQYNADADAQRVAILYRGMNGALLGLESIAFIALGAWQVLDGAFTLGTLLAFLAYKSQFISRATSVIDKFQEFRLLDVQKERLADVLLSLPEPRVDGVNRGAPQVGVSGTLELRSVSFRYSDFEPWVVRNLTFRIEAGESVALVGPSGCGKTTVMGLILGLMEAQRGTVTLDGVDTRTAGVDHMRSHVGAVLQDDALFAGSILENIEFLEEQPDLEWARECARRGCILDDIERMPMGLNTLVGDMGSVLSGGQRQRILIARALYKRPRILILDEATSHLDVATERAVNDAIRSMAITRLIIAHRPETISSADRVIELEHAEMAENHLD